MRVSVTFEFAEKQPLTTAWDIKAHAPGTAASRAVKAASRDLKGQTRGWTSIVVLVEREAVNADEVEG